MDGVRRRLVNHEIQGVVQGALSMLCPVGTWYLTESEPVLERLSLMLCAPMNTRCLLGTINNLEGLSHMTLFGTISKPKGLSHDHDHNPTWSDQQAGRSVSAPLPAELTPTTVRVWSRCYNLSIRDLLFVTI